MFIQTEATPNPATLKFLPGQDVMGAGGAANFISSDSAKRSPLATGLFTIEGIDGVFLGADFITVTSSGAKDWDVLKPQILGAIMDHFSSDQPVITEEAVTADSGEDDSVVTQIKELLDTRVRPAVAQDGGDIIFHGFEDGIVYLEMHGACAGCPSSSATLKHGIENMLKYYVPEVVEVRPHQ
ncbi:MAG: NifU family protein [Rhodospirillales bacterium]|nr:NifU family protein [Rhodospirillales bacterium]